MGDINLTWFAIRRAAPYGKPPSTKTDDRKMFGRLAHMPYTKYGTEYSKSYQAPSTYRIGTFADYVNALEFPKYPTHQRLRNSWVDRITSNTYCTEYCHIGSGYPLNAAVNTIRHENFCSGTRVCKKT